MASLTLKPAPSLQGELGVPGDKAISHRALIIGSGVRGRVEISGLSTAEDVRSTALALEKLGLLPSETLNKSKLEVDPGKPKASTSLKLEGNAGWTAFEQTEAVDCGNSGSTMRMLMGVLAGLPIEATLVGDASLSRRPMERVAAPLRLMGAEISLEPGGVPPVRMSGGRLAGIEYDLPVASAQLKTALLLAGLQGEGATILREPAVTRDHTERLLAYLGCEVRTGESTFSVEATQLFGDKAINIPGDFSSASFLLSAAAVVLGSDIVLRRVGTNPTRTAFIDVLRSFGAQVEITGEHEVSGEPRADIHLRSGERRAIVVEPAMVAKAIDELPLVAVLGCFADGETVVRGARELRVKESDRIAAITEGLSRMGADIRPLEDGFVVRGPSTLAGTRVGSHGDHRIAMALAVAALGAEGETTIEGWEAAAVSYPGFEADLATLVSE